MGRCLGRGNRYTSKALFVDNHGLGFDHARLLMALSQATPACPSCKGKCVPGVMVKVEGTQRAKSWHPHKVFPGLANWLSWASL